MVYVIFLCIALPLMLILPILEKRSRLLVGFLLMGMFVALAAYELDTILYPLTGMETLIFTQTVTPMVEETLKALPILVFVLVFSDSRNGILSIAMSVGIGFAVLENTVILVHGIYGVTLGWAALRGLSTGLMHGLCTMIIGFGLSFVKKQKKLFYTGIFGLWSVAVTLHAIFNLLISSDYTWLGACFPMLLYILFFLLWKISQYNISGRERNQVSDTHLN